MLTLFFMWCTILNGILLVFWAIFILLAPDWVYRLQNVWFPITRENFNLLIYSFMGLFKIFFLVFNLVPYLALLIIG